MKKVVAKPIQKTKKKWRLDNSKKIEANKKVTLWYDSSRFCRPIRRII